MLYFSNSVLTCYVLISEQAATFANNIDWLTLILYLFLEYTIYIRENRLSQLNTLLLSTFNIYRNMFRPR